MTRSLCLVATALSVTFALAAEHRSQPLLRVGRCAAPPIIDGKLDDDAWSRAAGLTGLVNIFHQRLSILPTTVRVAYDDERLYVAYDCVIPADARLVGAPGDRDTGRPWHDDSIEIFLSPDTNKPEAYFQLIGNWAGLIYDLRAGRPAWDAPWEFRSRVGPGRWCAEVAVPFAALEAPTPDPGNRWRVNFCRDVATPGKAYESWADVGQTYISPELFGWVEFGGEEPVIQVTSLGQPDHGRLRIRARAINPTARECNVELEARLLQPGTTLAAKGEDWGAAVKGKMEVARAEVVVPAGGVEEIELARDFFDADLRLLRLTARVVGGPELYRAELPVNLAPPLSLRLQPIPSQERLGVTVLTGGLRDVNRAETSAQIRALAPDGHQVAEATINPLSEVEATTWLDYSGWPVGECRIAVVVREGDTEIQRTTAEFKRPERPRWLGNELGTARVVVPPFTPLEYAGDAVECWGRRIAFGSAMLPTSITSGGEELLAGPMRLTVTLGGQRHEVRGDTGPTFTEQAEDRAEFVTAGTAAGARFRAEWWQEYDGFTWVELSCPEPPSTPVEALTLEIPLRRDQAQMIHGTGNKRRSGINEFVGEQAMRFAVLPMLWIGTNDRGLCWFVESSQGWRPHDSDQALELIPGEDRVILRLNLIAEPSTLDAGWRVAFGIIATPVKPLPPGWSTVNYDVLPRRRRTINWEEIGVRQDLGVVWNKSFAEHLTDPFHAKPALGDAVAEGHEHGILAVAYIAPGVHTMQREEPAFYLAEWRTEPPAEFYEWPGETYPRLCLNSSWQDYLLTGIHEMVGKHGLDGIYHDGGAPSYCQNHLHACGWEDKSGQRHRIRPIRAYRQYHKRLATMLYHDHGIENYAIYNHTSDVMFLPVFTFLTAHLDGEQYKGQKRAKVPYTEILSLKEVRPEYVSTQWGIINVFLDICERETEVGQADSATFLAYMLPHGVPFYPRYTYEQYAKDIFKLWAEFDARSATFHPYWRKLDGFEPQNDPAQVPVSAYANLGRLLVVAGNITDREQQAAISIDRTKLGLSGQPKVKRTVPELQPAWADGTLSVALPPNSFALVWLE